MTLTYRLRIPLVLTALMLAGCLASPSLEDQQAGISGDGPVVLDSGRSTEVTGTGDAATTSQRTDSQRTDSQQPAEDQQPADAGSSTTGKPVTTDSEPGESGTSDVVMTEPPVPRPLGTSWIPGGHFLMGSQDGFPDELPRHDVALDGFWMDQTEVTVAEFKRFADATGYVTVAERKPRREDFADQLTPEELLKIPEENLVAGSICFNPKFDRELFPADRRPEPHEIYLVWKYERGANWRHPNGPESDIADRMDHPVTHVSWTDCQAYCEWAGRRLPTEAEWEYAGRGGLTGKTYPWGDDREPEGRWMTNIWQGKWPFKNFVQDGFEDTAPVRSYEPNGYGLYEMSGNVWEWCQDWYQPDYYATSPKRNPSGPVTSFDPNEPNVPKRVQRGGSFMCNANYCTGYRVAARMKGDIMSGTWHCGFRCVVPARNYESFRAAPGAVVVTAADAAPGADQTPQTPASGNE